MMDIALTGRGILLFRRHSKPTTELLRIHRLYADEQMIQIFRNIVPDKQLAKIQVTQYTLESIPALGQDFFAVSYKKESANLSRVLFPEVSVIKCSNYRLTGTSMIKMMLTYE